MDVYKPVEFREHPAKDNPELSVRQCSVCKQTKDNVDFHKAKSGVNGRYSICKSCRKPIESKKYENNKWLYTCRLKKAFCKKHDITFDLTPEYLESIYTDTCPVFGIKFQGNKCSDFSATLDRIDPSKGYVQGNVCFISHRANRIKYDSSVTELEQILEWYKSATTSGRFK